MNYLHSFKPNPILYLDLHPGNLLICREQLKLIDFDQAALASLSQERSVCYGTKGFAAPNSTREGLWMRGSTSMPLAPSCTIWGQGMPQRGDKSRTGKLSRRSVHSYGAMSQNREKERCQSVREVLEALEKLEARIFAERHIPLLRIAAAGSRSGIRVTHTALGAVDICGRKEFPAFTGSRMTRGQSAGWHPGMGWRRMNMEFITWTVWR